MVSAFGGYNKKFVESPPDDYRCLICHSVCRDPQQATCCAKLYCQACLDEYTKTNRTCPTCRKHMVTFEDKLSHRRIKVLKVSCDNEDAGCQWAGELGSIEEHMAKCEFVEIRCTNGCSKEVLRRDLDYHLTTSCPKRKYECPHCSLVGEHGKITTTHLNECPDMVITCKNDDCDVQTKRSEMENHLAVCPKEQINCPFAEVGCKETMVREQLDKHKSENIQAHLEQAITTLHDKVKRIESFKPVVFKVPNFQQFKEARSTWHSTEFWTHPRGYRMILSVQVREDEEQKRLHLAVYTYIRSGIHDDSLAWPFRGNITIELLNQLEDKEHHCMVLNFPDSSTHQSTMKPLKGQSNAGWGYPRFISCDSLGYNEKSNCQYLMDDCLYLRVYNVTVECIQKPWLAPTS